jgi:hypothetical protein
MLLVRKHYHLLSLPFMRRHLLLPITLLAALGSSASRAADSAAASAFHKQVEPVLQTYCYECHGDGNRSGGVALDEFDPTQNLAESRDLWLKALKNLRSGIMPPAKKPRPSAAEQQSIVNWIKYDDFGIDPKNPDPGRVTVRRLNRAEYRNTIRDLMGVDFDTGTEFPPDDAGNGFDNNGDVLTISPMLLEKYIGAAQTIVARVVPMSSKVVVEQVISGGSFRKGSEENTNKMAGPLSLSYYDAATVSNSFQIEHPGRYQAVLKITAVEKYVDNQFDYNKCRLIFRVDDQVAFTHDYNREGAKPLHYEFDEQWAAGTHTVSVEMQPLTPDEKKIRSLAIRLEAVTLRGPFDEKYEVAPKDYARFFPKPVPDKPAARRAYAREILGNFAFKAFRRPVDDATVSRLTGLAENLYSQPKQTFESGVAQAMVAVLASPEFLFREEAPDKKSSGKGSPLIDEYSLASRLSYFLWSSMPDDELFHQATAGTLRKNLAVEVKRMLDDPRSSALLQNFCGQWLETRDIATVQIDARAVLAREDDPPPRAQGAGNAGGPPLADAGATPNRGNAGGFAGGRGRGGRGRGGFGRGGPRADLDDLLRGDMKAETEMYVGHIMHDDRSVMELVESDYDFLNERLAKHYGLTNLNVTGTEMREVTLPPDCIRGGVLTMGSVLAVTSNPTRTSPVKRGVFILDKILGAPTPPPPANVPPLEDSESSIADHPPVLREVLALHRQNAMCASCHNRLDPPGLALENFNAMGMFRAKERGQAIESGGQLITGETFTNVQELKHILATAHRVDFYRCLTEKMMMYALGRGLEFYDVESVDRVVASLDQTDGRFSSLLMGVIESAPFQKRRSASALAEAEPPKTAPQRVSAKLTP